MKALIFLVLLCQAIPGSAMTLEAYGDSLTAGFFSNEKGLTNPPPLKEISKILSDLGMFILTGDVSYRDPHEYPHRDGDARADQHANADQHGNAHAHGEQHRDAE